MADELIFSLSVLVPDHESSVAVNLEMGERELNPSFRIDKAAAHDTTS